MSAYLCKDEIKIDKPEKEMKFRKYFDAKHASQSDRVF